MWSNVFIIVLALLAWQTNGAHERDSRDPDRLQVCGLSDRNNGTRGVSRGIGSRELERGCPHVQASDCRSRELIRCGRCMTCLVYLGRGEVCERPYKTNARCSPDLICYTRGTCGDLVR